MNTRKDCTVCFYRSGRLVMETTRLSRDEAHMEVLAHALDAAADAEVTIYRSGRALKGWHMKPLAEVAT